MGAPTAAPNPMVGSVLVSQGRVLAEGWHASPGQAHAEAACLRAFGDGAVPSDAVLYVNLEPCAHHGRTGPCADLLIARGVREVVMAHRDPFPAVNGLGMQRLRDAGVRVTEGVLEEEARWLNRRFITSVTKQRPYIILKWARSRDGFLDRAPRTERKVQRITSPATDVLVHRWRSEEQAIMVGSRTVAHDDPRLDVRHVDGRSPLRVIIDRAHRAPDRSRVFDGSRPTLLFTSTPREAVHAEQIMLGMEADPLDQVLAELHARGIRSLMVEGGAVLLKRFLSRALWDEARLLTGTAVFGDGTIAPSLGLSVARSAQLGTDVLDLFVNPSHQSIPQPEWSW